MNYSINTKEQLENFVFSKWDNIEKYFENIEKDLPIPIYSSVDIRENTEKYAPVDHNLYPAGFNNLCYQDLDRASNFFKEHIGEKIKSMAIIPEAHTTNKFYLDHLLTLKKSLKNAGYLVYVVSLEENLFEGETETISLESHSKGEVILHKGTLQNRKITINGQAKAITFDFICLNNDQSRKMGVNWDLIDGQISPPSFMGWINRKKSRHFKNYRDTVISFGKEFLINPNLLMADFTHIENLNFATKEGIEFLTAKVESFQKELLNKNAPIFIKADQGTYGMGIMVVHDYTEIMNMNRKTRNKMDVGKNNLKFQSVLIQEGIETALTENNMPAEVTVYLAGGKVTGGFLRANQLKGPKDNLNSKGMIFKRLCLSERRKNYDVSKEVSLSQQKRDAVYEVVGRLSNIAAAKEIQEVEKILYPNIKNS